MFFQGEEGRQVIQLCRKDKEIQISHCSLVKLSIKLTVFHFHLAPQTSEVPNATNLYAFVCRIHLWQGLPCCFFEFHTLIPPPPSAAQVVFSLFCSVSQRASYSPSIFLPYSLFSPYLTLWISVFTNNDGNIGDVPLFEISH